jgi:hypothetical protein
MPSRRATLVLVDRARPFPNGLTRELIPISQDPGLSLSAAYESARQRDYTGNKGRFTEELTALEASGKVENRGSTSRQKWYVTEAN